MHVIIPALQLLVKSAHKYDTMPRLSLYRPNRTNDYQFLDRTISEQYTVGGLDIYVHKYLGPKTGDPGDADITIPVREELNPLFIEDLLLLENRDRAYDPDVYVMRGVYRVQDIDFDLTQFGLFLNNDTLFITFHYNDMIDTFGRKLMSGDVLEFPNLKDYNPLNAEIPLPLPRYYVIQDAAFAQEGFSVTWLPHLWRVKATPLVNAQEYQDIMKQPFVTNQIWDPGNFYPNLSVVNNGDQYYRANGNVPVGTAIDAVNPSTGQPYWTLITDPNTYYQPIPMGNRLLPTPVLPPTAVWCLPPAQRLDWRPHPEVLDTPWAISATAWILPQVAYCHPMACRLFQA